MKLNCFDVDQQEHVAHVRFVRSEKRNSMTAEFWAEFPELIAELDRSGTIRAIVLSSTGPHFSTGIDLSVLESTGSPDDGSQQQQAARFRDTVLRLQSSFNSLEACRVPVLAAVQGGCIGSGLDLISACDMRYASEDAFFTIYETNLAMTADVGTFPRLCKLIPDGLVRELAYTGRALSSEEACRAGLVNKVYENQAVMLDSVLEIATCVARKAPMAVHGCKQLILHARDHSVSDTLEYAALWNAAFFKRDEVLEAMTAMKDQRAGSFASLPSLTKGDRDLKLP